MADKDAVRVTKLLKEKTPERIQPKTLLIAALTAVTVATVSLQLTGLVSSLTLVAVASLMTAFVSEFYRIALELFHRSVSRQVEKVVQKSALEVQDGELHLVESDHGAGEEKESSDSEEEAQLEEELAAPEGRSYTALKLRKRALSVLASRWGIPIFFTLVAFATLALSYLFGAASAPEDYVVNREIVQVKDISDEQAEELAEASERDAARAEAEAARLAALRADEAVEEATSESSELISLTRRDLLTLIDELSETIATLEAANAAQASTVDELTRDSEELQRTLALLQARVAAIENEPAPAPAPTVTAPPVEPEPTPAAPE